VSAVVVAMGLAIAAIGLLGVVSPERLLGLVRAVQTPSGLYVAAAVRLLLGVALWLAAPGSRAPELFRGLGAFVFLAGVATPFFGLPRYRKLLEWWQARGAAFTRVWALVACAFGLCIVYLAIP
jgi:hypothetical protein